MKVLHIIPSVNPALGGPTHVVLNLVKALRTSGVDAQIATTNDWGKELLDVPLNQCIEYEQVPVWFFKRFSPPLKEFIFSAQLTRWLWKHARDYDLIHTHYLFSYASTCAGAIARLQKVPYIMRTIGQLSPWALGQSRLKKQIYTAAIERHNLNQAAAIHCTCAGEAQDVQNFGIATPTLTLPLGVEIPQPLPNAKQQLRAKYHISPETPILLFLSRLHYKKRPELLLRSLTHLANQNFHLILAGSGEPSYITELQNLASSLGLSNRITFAGFVTGYNKQILLQGAELFVLPSFSENFGVAVAEAMSHSLPVIVTPGVQIAPEIATAKAGLIVQGEAEALRNAIALLLNSPQLRQELGENGRRLCKENYSWNAIASHLQLVYTSVTQKPAQTLLNQAIEQPNPEKLNDPRIIAKR